MTTRIDGGRPAAERSHARASAAERSTAASASGAGAGAAGGGRLRALWYRCSVRAHLLITFVVISLCAALAAGVVTIVNARKATGIEITASLELAERLVRQEIESLRERAPSERLLAELSLELKHLRHVRLLVKDAADRVVSFQPAERTDELTRESAREDAPAWFAALIRSDPDQHEVPVVAGGRRLGTIVVEGEPEDEIAEVWEDITALALVALLVNLVMIGVFYVVLGWILDPLVTLTKGLRDLENRRYKVRLALPKVRELAAISGRFNALAETLEATMGENQRLTRQLVRAEDDERHRIALELHDEVGPCLFGIEANASSVAAVVATIEHERAEDVRTRVQAIISIVDRLRTTNRSILKRLQPMALGHVPLAELVGELVRDFELRHPDTRFGLSTDLSLRTLGDPIDLTVYRCVQEGLTNAVRHAGARNVEVDLRLVAAPFADPSRPRHRFAPGRVILSIRDDGRGIPKSMPAGFGLTGMSERVRALCGSFAIAANPAGGTSLSIDVPIDAAVAAGGRESDGDEAP